MLVALTLSQTGYAQYTAIPDANFEQKLIDLSIDSESTLDGQILTADAAAQTGTLDISNSNISDLTGIEAFVNITGLWCYANQLTSLDVSNNTALTILWCRSNQLTSLDVSNNTALTILFCFSNQLTSLDVSNNTALTELACYSNQLTSLDVSNNTALTTLRCNSNALTSLDVSNNTALTELRCNSNQLPSLGVSNNTALISLRCNSNALTSLDVSNNTALAELDCYENQLTSLDVSNNTTLYDLWCYSNQLTSLDVSQNTALIRLFCNSNQLTSLNVSNNTALTNLNCSSNQLPILDVSNNTALRILWCRSNQLTSLDVSNNTALEDLWCFSNQLTSLDVSNNTALEDLSCYSNQLTSLDVSNNTALTSLNCRSNQLTSLNIKNGNNTNFTFFNATSNPNLTCIQVDDLTWANTNWSGNVPSGAVFKSNPCSDYTAIPDANFEQKLIDLGIDSEGGTPDGLILTADAAAKTGTLDVSNSNISDLTGIEAFVNITGLDCYSNQLTSLDVSNNTALTNLNCRSNQLTSLDVSQNTALTRLDCYSNQLPSLNVSNNTALTNLNCSSNQLTSLDVSNNTALTSLNCQSNQLTSLDMSNNTALTILWCYLNPLTSLDVSNNTALEELYCRSNPLTSLDVSNNTALTDLFCQSNQLTSLDVSNNTALTRLDCSSNQLTSLNVKNGNNTNFTFFSAKTNPNLTCIQVDDPVYSATNWSNVDAGVQFSTTGICCELSVTCPPTSLGTIACDGTIPTAATDESSFEALGGSTDIDDGFCGTVSVSAVDVTTGTLCPSGQTVTRTYTISDDNDTETCVQTLEIKDLIAPSITCPADVTIECDASSDPSNTGMATATDACDTNPVITFADAMPASCGTTGIIARTWTATDDCNNSSDCSQTITIQDTTDPVIGTPASDLTLDCSSTTNTTDIQNWLNNAGGAAATDNCGTPTWTNDYTALNGCGITGTATVTFTATDACGNTSTTSAVLTVNPDLTGPTVGGATNMTVECDGSGNTTALNTWLANNAGATASDACGGVTWSNDFTALSDDCGAVGSATVIFTATDDCGNLSFQIATFTIEDTTDPIWTNEPMDMTVECDGAGNTAAYTNWLASFSGSDACGNATLTHNASSLSDDCAETGSETVTFTLTDDCGNVTTKDATFTIEDTQGPAIAVTNVTVESDGAGNASDLTAFLASASATEACGMAGAITDDFTSFVYLCGMTTTATVTFSATDDCGNVGTASAVFTIEDTTPPSMDTDASDMTVECDGAGNMTELTNWLSANGGAAATDINSGVTWSNDFSALSDLCGATGAATVTFTATDACGNAATTSATFTIEDTTDPTWSSEPMDMTVECDGAGNTAALATWLSSFSGSDACGGAMVSHNSAGLSDDCGETGTETVTFTLTDDCGNAITKDATFTIEDTTAPSIDTDASDMTVSCASATNMTDLTAWLANNGGAAASDVCGGVTWTNDHVAISGGCGPTGSTTVTFTATDDCGNASTTTATFTIETDNTSPMVTGATHLTVECDGSGNMTELNTWLANNGGSVGTDICSAITWTNNYDANNMSDDCGMTGSLLVMFTATDECGNIGIAGANFTIEDTTAPSMDTPASDMTVECDGAGNMTELNAWLNANGNAVASDLCGNVTWSNDYTALSDDCGETGSATVTFTATDDCGNASMTSATFTIEDTAGPVFTSNDMTVECDGSGNITQLNTWLSSYGSFTGSDVCGSIVSWSDDFTMLSDDCGMTGSATVTFSATDDCGNVGTASATFTIEDTTAPSIDTDASDMTVECDGSGNMTELNTWLSVNGNAAASDACGGVTWSNDYASGSGLSDDCGATGSVTVTFTATDDCGNASTTTADFTIEDTTAPVIGTASDMTVECDGAGNTTQLNTWLANAGSATGSDACGGITWTNDYATGTGLSDDCGATGSVTVTFTATDDCGNASTTSATFTIEDTTAPSMDTPASDMTVECDGAGNMTELNTWLGANGGASATDDCGNVTWSNDYAAANMSDLCGATGAVTVEFTATDDCNNVSVTTATFTIESTVGPDITLSDETVECDGAGNMTELNAWLAANGNAVVNASCSSLTWSNDFTALSDDCGETGSATVSFTATDECGNATTKSATFTIEDTTGPDINTDGIDMTVECDGNGNVAAFNTWLANAGGAAASDACGGTVTWTSMFTGVTGNCGTTLVNNLMFTATDECGNTSTTTASFIIEDTTGPDFDTEAQDMTVTCDNMGNIADITAFLANNGGAVASDACSGMITWSNDYTSLTIPGTTTITFTATDECGNMSMTSADFTVTGCIFKWDGEAGDGMWTTALNWTTDVVPTASDDVLIDNTDAVLLTGNTTAIKSLTLVRSSSLEISTTGDLTISGAPLYGVRLSNSTSQLKVSGQLTVLNSTDDGIFNSGTVTVMPGGVIDIDGAGGYGFHNSISDNLVNNGTINITGSVDDGLFNKGTVTNNSGAVIMIDAAGDYGITNSVDDILSNHGSIIVTNSIDDGIINSGTIINESSGNLMITDAGDFGIYNNVGNNLVNKGTLTISSSTDDGIYNRGTVANETGGTLKILNSGDFGFSNAAGGDLLVKSLMEIDNSVNDGVSNNSSVTIEPGGELRILSAGDFGFYNNTNDFLVNNGLLSITNCTDDGINNRGTVTNNSTGEIRIDGAGDFGINVASGKSLMNSGMIEIVNPSDDGIFNNGIFTNMTSGMIEVSGSTDKGIYNLRNGILLNDGELLLFGNSGISFSNLNTVTNNGSLIGEGSYLMRSNDLGGTISVESDDTGNTIGQMSYLGLQTLTGTLEIDVEGVLPGTDHDLVTGSSKVTVAACDLVVNFGSYAPVGGDRIVFLTTGTGVVGAFTPPSLPSGWSIDYSVSKEVALVYMSLKPTAPVVNTIVAETPQPTVSERILPTEGETIDIENALISVYPNPVESGGEVNIKLENEGAGRLVLFNQFGQLLQSQAFEQGQTVTRFKLPNVAAGIYILQLESGEKFTTKRLQVN